MTTPTELSITTCLAISLNGNEISNLDDYDVFNAYRDNWISERRKDHLSLFGIEKGNITKIRTGAGDATTTSTEAEDTGSHGGGIQIELRPATKARVN